MLSDLIIFLLFLCMRAVAFDNNTYPLPALIARFANAYSSTNQDLKNTNGTNFASNEYLNATDELKDVREWIASGLSDEMILSLLPSPKASDIINPEILTPILVSKPTAESKQRHPSHQLFSSHFSVLADVYPSFFRTLTLYVQIHPKRQTKSKVSVQLQSRMICLSFS
jgi:hypothetical protein